MTREEEIVLIQLGLKTLINDQMNPKPKIKTIKYKKIKKAKKRTMSDAGRKRISAMMKKRWKDARKSGKNSL